MLRTVSELIIISFIMEVTLQQDAHVKFSCHGRVTGYYADVDSGCQIYHMCDGLGRQFSYSCPNTTLFQQRMLICDHWYMVNCSRSEIDYGANLLIGQNKPFVEDSEKQVYHRTPRPDLLSQPTASEFNIIYRKQGSQNNSDLNLVGVNSDYDQNNGSSTATDKPAYHLPSHWSTEYSKENVTPSLVNVQEITEGKGSLTTPLTNILSIDQTQITQNKRVVLPRENRNEQNRETTIPSFIRNTQMNKKFEGSNETRNKTILKVQLVPIPKAINFDSNNLDNAIKSKSTNSFPKKEIAVNFKSLFKATTPVFPTKEELGTTESPVDDILKPPGNNDYEHVATLDIPPLTSEKKQVLPTSPPNSFIQSPSNIFQPPKLEPDYTTEDGVTEQNNYSVKTESNKSIKGKIKTSTRLSNDKMFKDIRKIFSIPDYEFPLDTASRPGYDQSLDSFQVNPFLVDVKPRQHAS